MPLNKVKPGSNMYSFVNFTHSHLAGECPNLCSYCYVQSMARRFPGLRDRYSGPPRLVEKELKVNYGLLWRPDGDPAWRSEKTIFVENCSDLFAEGIPRHMISSVILHCYRSHENEYVFQTKNPARVGGFLDFFPPRFLIGTTAESNRHFQSMSISPTPLERLKAMRFLNLPSSQKFITIEPILRFDVDQFVDEIRQSYADTIYVGADSKGHHLPEPTGPEIGALVEGLRAAGKKVVLKPNLKRIYRGD